MSPVEETQQVFEWLHVWQGYDPSVKADLSSSALQLGGGMFFIDPVPLAEEPLAALVERAAPAAVIVTNANHARAADAFRHKFSVPVFAHVEGRDEIGIRIDNGLEDGEIILDKITALHLPGAAPGEMALYSAEHGGVMTLGDALIGVEPRGFMFLPATYCRDARRMRESLQKLLQFSFETMTFAHGMPIVCGARKRLEQWLESS